MKDILKKLTIMANNLDAKGLYQQADEIDKIVKAQVNDELTSLMEYFKQTVSATFTQAGDGWKMTIPADGHTFTKPIVKSYSSSEAILQALKSMEQETPDVWAKAAQIRKQMQKESMMQKEAALIASLDKLFEGIIKQAQAAETFETSKDPNKVSDPKYYEYPQGVGKEQNIKTKDLAVNMIKDWLKKNLHSMTDVTWKKLGAWFKKAGLTAVMAIAILTSVGLGEAEAKSKADAMFDELNAATSGAEQVLSNTKDELQISIEQNRAKLFASASNKILQNDLKKNNFTATVIYHLKGGLSEDQIRAQAKIKIDECTQDLAKWLQTIGTDAKIKDSKIQWAQSNASEAGRILTINGVQYKYLDNMKGADALFIVVTAQR